MTHLLAMYLAYKHAMKQVSDWKKWNVFSDQVPFSYANVYQLFQKEYDWMYNILNPRIEAK